MLVSKWGNAKDKALYCPACMHQTFNMPRAK